MLNNNQGSKNMNITKYIKTPLASETELLSYKLLLNSQITDAQEVLILIEKQLKKIKLREANDIKKPEGRKDQDLIDKKWREVSELGI